MVLAFSLSQRQNDKNCDGCEEERARNLMHRLLRQHSCAISTTPEASLREHDGSISTTSLTNVGVIDC